MGGLIALVILVLFVSSRIARSVLHPERETREEAVALQIERGNLAPGEIDDYPMEKRELAVFDGTRLAYYWLRCGAGTNKAVVCAHGFGARHEHMLKNAKQYLARGYDVLLFDQRNHGASGGKRTTMGFLERRDAMELVSLARQEKGIVGLHGESMGAATAVLAACLTDAPPDFVVADCGYDDCFTQIRYVVAKREHIPPYPFIWVADAITKLVAGFNYREVSPARELAARNGLPDVPVLFIHGTADKYVPVGASERLFAAKTGKKALYICEGAEHVRSISVDREKYERVLYSFLDEYGF